MPDSFWTDDLSLQHLLERHLTPEMLEWGRPILEKAGNLAAKELDELATLADRNGPTLVSKNQNSQAVDEIHFHPSYGEMERLIYGELAIVGMIYGTPPPNTLPPPGGRAPRVLALGVGHLTAQSDAGLFCPVCMTDGVARTLEKHAAKNLAEAFVPKLAIQYANMQKK